MSSVDIDNFKKNEASRIEALRMKKKNAKEEAKALLKMTKTPPNPYKSRQSFSKAVNWLKTDLPESPRKQAAVIAKLAGEYGCSFENNKQVESEIKEAIETFFRTDIVYTMPCKGEMTIWTDQGRKRVQKYFLTMYLKEAYGIFLELHENLFQKLEAMGISYEKTWWETILCNISENSDCWLNNCEVCKDGIELIPSKSLHTVTSYKQWCSVEVPNHDPTAESYKKIAIVTKDVQVGEVLENFQESFSKSKEHQNVKHIQAEAFQEDIKNPSKRVLQIGLCHGISMRTSK